jgi:phosphatidylserine decarboxylase
MPYSVSELLTEKSNYIQKIKNGTFVNLYLSPKDYHRYHMPMDLEIKQVIHKSGKLYPVNFTYLNKQLNLFCENERVIIEAITNDEKIIYIVLVGALNVGKMRITFEPKIETNSEADKTLVYSYENLKLKKGECFGNFEMGSTILMFFEKDFIQLEDIQDKKIKFTDNIGKRI